MIYLILDTNIWLYLANGYDPETSGNQKPNLHFELLDSLKKLKDDNDICVLVSEVVIEEWKRNKHQALIKIDKLNRKLENIDGQINNLLQYSPNANRDEIRLNIISGINKEINENEKHIKSVEKFLFEDCEIIEITDEVKLKIFDLSIKKEAPFHNNKNNIADATILFTADSYLKEKLFHEGTAAIFVSNNFKDFTDGKNKDDFHPQIFENLECNEIQYQRVLPAALNLSYKIIVQIEEYFEREQWLDSITFHCLTPYCEGIEDYRPWGYADRKMKVIDSTGGIVNPNQVSLFSIEAENKKEFKEIELGECVNCGTLHIDCPVCNEFIYVEDTDGEFECYECNARLDIQRNEVLNEVCLHILSDEEE